MKLFRIALATAALAMGATPALAADFTGPRVDVHAARDVTTGVAGEDATTDGLGFGVQVGYDAAITDKLTLGVEAGVDFSNAKDVYDVSAVDFRSRVSALRDLSVGARLGVKASENLLVYGGVAYTNAGYQDYTRLGTTIDRSKPKLDGYRLSGGALIGLTDSLALKAEYRWSDYEGDITRSAVLVGASYRF